MNAIVFPLFIAGTAFRYIGEAPPGIVYFCVRLEDGAHLFGLVTKLRVR